MAIEISGTVAPGFEAARAAFGSNFALEGDYEEVGASLAAFHRGMALDTPDICGSNLRAFGHSGWGGSFGCADPDANVAIGYVCNQMGPDLVGDPRTMGLCLAVFESAAKS